MYLIYNSVLYMDTSVVPARKIVLSTEAEREYENLRNFLMLRFQKPYTPVKIFGLISGGVIFMSKAKNVDGLEKKELVLAAIRDVIDLSGLGEEEKNELLMVVDTFGDSAIEEFVKLGKDMISFAQKKCKGRKYLCC